MTVQELDLRINDVHVDELTGTVVVCGSVEPEQPPGGPAPT